MNPLQTFQKYYQPWRMNDKPTEPTKLCDRYTEWNPKSRYGSQCTKVNPGQSGQPNCPDCTSRLWVLKQRNDLNYIGVM